MSLALAQHLHHAALAHLVLLVALAHYQHHTALAHLVLLMVLTHLVHFVALESYPYRDQWLSKENLREMPVVLYFCSCKKIS